MFQIKGKKDIQNNDERGFYFFVPIQTNIDFKNLQLYSRMSFGTVDSEDIPPGRQKGDLFQEVSVRRSTGQGTIDDF